MVSNLEHTYSYSTNSQIIQISTAFQMLGFLNLIYKMNKEILNYLLSSVKIVLSNWEVILTAGTGSSELLLVSESDSESDVEE